jgi:hypothetical protein
MAKKNPTVKPIPEGFKTLSMRFWEPEPNDSVTGAYLGYQEMKSRARGKNKGLDYKAYKIAEKETGEELWFSGKAFEKTLEPLKVGTVVYIRFEGKIKLDGGKTFKQFTIAQQATK